MRLSPQQAAFLSAHHLVDQLYASGVRSIWLSPGFRNSPVIAAAHRYGQTKPELRISTGVDERGAGFAALGEAMGTGRPVAIVCTSGTAVANLYPAALEAAYAGVPLVIVSCDRPQELIGVGANQTMEQWDFFRGARRYFANVVANGGELGALKNIRHLVAKAVSKSEGGFAGPAHLNVAFREPFAFTESDITSIPKELLEISGPVMCGGDRVPSRAAENIVRERLQGARRVFVSASIGALNSSEVGSLEALCEKKGWALCVEGFSSKGSVSADIFLRDASAVATLTPDVSIRIGAPLIGKNLNAHLVTARSAKIIFDDSGEARNPECGGADIVEGSYYEWISFLDKLDASGDSGYRKSFVELGRSASAALNDLLESEKDLTEWHVSKAVGCSLVSGTNLFLGNSMPVRDFLWVGGGYAEADYEIFSNRGLSGIDGLIASAVGVAMNGRPTVALIGDLSAGHDASSIALLAQVKSRANISVLILNNGGGEIFRMVDTAKYPVEEMNFTTPVSVDFEALAGAYGVPYARITKLEELPIKLNERLKSGGVKVVEICVARERSTAIRKEFFARWKK